MSLLILVPGNNLGGSKVQFIYYSAPWCGPCKRVWPWVKRIAEEVGADVETVDISDGAEGILSVPTLDIMAAGETLKRIVRWSGPKALMREIEELL